MPCLDLVQSLLKPEAYHPRPNEVKLHETHISWVFLAGDYAYKVKKPVHFNFLDFSTLALRQFYCVEEVRLNGRFSNGLYLGVVPITEHDAHQHLIMDGIGQPVEYAIKMRRFNDIELLSYRIINDQLSEKDIEHLARSIATFHLERAEPLTSTLANVCFIHPHVLANFEILHSIQTAELQIDADVLSYIEGWANARFDSLKEVMRNRHHNGLIRECHGDLHLMNIVMLDHEPVPFDGIEFSLPLRWIDIANEVAFLLMDLEVNNRNDLAYAFLNRYLEHTGDYEGLKLHSYFKAYRAMVRAKVNAIELQQTQMQDQRQHFVTVIQTYLEYAYQLTQKKHKPFLVMMCGLSGSGKSHVAHRLALTLGAIHIRSDVIRKKLKGYGPLDTTRSPEGSDIYTDDISEKTYQELLKIAELSLGSDFNTILDATYLKLSQRTAAIDYAKQLGFTPLILLCQASPPIAKQRILDRERLKLDPSEASLSVYENQSRLFHPLGTYELSHTLIISTDQLINIKEIEDHIKRNAETL